MPNTPPLTDAQKALLAAGRKLAKELGLTHFSTHMKNMQEVEFTDGQTALIVGPKAIIVGTIEVKTVEMPTHRYTETIVKDAFFFCKREQKENGNWVPSTLRPDWFLPANAKLYV